MRIATVRRDGHSADESTKAVNPAQSELERGRGQAGTTLGQVRQSAAEPAAHEVAHPNTGWIYQVGCRNYLSFLSALARPFEVRGQVVRPPHIAASHASFALESRQAKLRHLRGSQERMVKFVPRTVISPFQENVLNGTLTR